MLKIFLLQFIFISSLFAIERGNFYGAKVSTQPNWFKHSFLDLGDDIDEATEENKYVIIYFHQDGCPYCAKLIEDNFKNPKLLKKIRDNFDVIEINMFGDKHLTDWNGKEFSEKSFAKHLNIQFTPSLLFLSKDKKIVLRLNGYQSTQKMQLVLDYLINKEYKNINFAKYKQQTTPSSNNKLINESFFEQPPFILTRSKNNPALQPLAVFFEEPNCQKCTELHNGILKLANTKKYLKQMEVMQLDINSNSKLITPSGKRTTAKQWYSDLNLTYTPAVVFFDNNGKEIIRKDAFLKTFHFHSVLTYVLDKAYLKQPHFQRYIENKVDIIRASGRDVDIWE